MKTIFKICFPLFSLCLATVAGCVGPAAGAHPATLATAPAPARLYRVKCASCHALPDPQGLTRTEWRRVLPEMSARAHLQDEQREAIYRYILGPDELSPAACATIAPLRDL